MNIADAYASKYLKSSDFDEDGSDMTIRDVVVEQLGKPGEDQEVKPVLYFKGEEKGLVLNKTNARRVAKLYGTETDDWVGKAVTVFQDETDFGGNTVKCLRIKTKAPTKAPQASAEIDPEDIPF